MRIRTFVSSAAIVTALLSSSSLVTQAMAQKGVVGTPSSDWAITKVDDAGGAYCALARKYSTNAVMTFAENSGEEASFALDFQRPILQVGNTMDVVLDPGAGQERSFDVQPVSNKAFVVRLGRDGAFFDALQKTGFLRVVASGQTYHFSLSDMEAGQERMDGCIASITAPAAGNEEAIEEITLSADVAHDKKASEDSELASQLKAAQKKNDTLQKKLEEARSRASNEDELAELTSKIESLKTENQQLSKRLKEATATLSSANAYQDEIAQLTAENNILKTDLAQKGADSGLIEQLRQQIAKGENENRLLQETASKARETLEREATQKISELEKALEAQRAENEKKSAALEQIGKTSADLAALEEINATLQKKVAALQAVDADSAALKEQMAKLEVENKNYIEKLEFAESQAPVAQETIAALKAENEEMKLTMANAEGAVSARVAALEEKNLSIKQILRNLIPVAERHKAASAEKDEKIAALEQKFAAYEEKTLASEAKLAEMQAAQNSLSTQNARASELQKALEEIIAVADRYKIASEEKDLKIVALEQAGQEQQALLSKLEEDKTAMNEELRLSQEKAKTLEEQIASVAQVAAKDLEKMASLEAELKAMNAENLKVKDELEAALNAVPEPEAAALVSSSAGEPVEEAEQEIAADIEAVTKAIQESAAASPAAENQTDVESEKPQADIAQNEENAAPPSVDATVASAETEEPAEPVLMAEAEESVEPRAEKKMAPLPARKATPPQKSQQEIAARAPGNAPNVESAMQMVAADKPVRNLTPVRLIPPSAMRAHKQTVQKMEMPAPVVEQQAKAQRENYKEEKVLEAENADVAMAEVLDQIAPAAGQEGSPLEVPVDTSSMSEAQKLELEVSRNIGRQKNLLQDAQQKAEAVKMNAAANKVKAEMAKNVSAQPVPAVKSEGAQAALPSSPIEKEVVSAPLAVRQSEDPYAPIPKPGVDQVPAPVKKEALAAQEATKRAAGSPVSAASASATASGNVAATLPDILGMANVAKPDDVSRVKESSAGAQAYQWKRGDVYGTAEQSPIASESEFDGKVKNYIERTQSRCPGDFAVVPTDSTGEGASRADSYEVACVGSKVSSGASLLFFNKGGVFTVVAHEAPTEALDQAINNRDQVLKVINTGS